MTNILFALLIIIYQNEISSHPYVLVNRSMVCNCGIEAENNFLLESLAACHNTTVKEQILCCTSVKV